MARQRPGGSRPASPQGAALGRFADAWEQSARQVLSAAQQTLLEAVKQATRRLADEAARLAAPFRQAMAGQDVARDRLAGRRAAAGMAERQALFPQERTGRFAGRGAESAVNDLEEQDKLLAKIRASMDPGVLRERLRLEGEITRALRERERLEAEGRKKTRKDYDDEAGHAREMEAHEDRGAWGKAQALLRQRRVRDAIPVAGPPTAKAARVGPDEYRGRALLEAVDHLREQERILQRIHALNDPEIRKKSLRTEAEINRLTHERENALRRMSLNQSMRPEQLRRDVEIERKERDLHLAREKERGRQAPLTATGNVLGSMLGGYWGNQQLEQLSSRTATMSGVFEGVGAPKMLAAAMGGVIAALPAATEGLQKLGGAIVALAGKASPGALIRYNMALDDTAAVFGNVLTPALEFMTDGLRLFADFMKAVLPSRADMEAMFAPFREALRELRPALAELAPVLRQLASETLRQLAFALTQIVKGFKSLVDIHNLLSGGFLMDKKKKLELPDTTGQAPRQAQITDMASLARRNYEMIAMQSGGAKDAAQQTADNTAQTNQILNQILEYLGPNAGSRVGDNIAGWLGWAR